MINQFRIYLHVAIIFAVAAGLFWSQLRTEDRRLLTWKPIGFALFALLCCYMSPSLALFDALLVLSLPVLARSRPEAAALFLVGAVTIPTLPGSLKLGSLFLIPFSATNALSVGLVLSMLLTPRVRVGSRGRSDAAVLLVAVVMGTIAARGTTSTDGLRHVISMCFDLLLPYACLSRSFETEQDFRRLVLAFAMIGFCFCVESVYEARMAFPAFKQMVEHYTAATDPLGFYRILIRVRGGFMRATGSFDEPTTFSIFLAFVLLALFCVRGSMRSRAGHYMLIFVAALGLFFTQSRGGWVTALFGLLALDLYRRRYAVLTGKIGVIGACGLLLVLAALSVPRLSQMLGMTGAALDSAHYRQLLVSRGLQEFRHAPLIGRDQTTVTHAMPDLVQGEKIVDFVNGWIYFLLMSGVVGTAMMIGSVALPTVLLVRARQRLQGHQRSMELAGFLFVSAALPICYFFTIGPNPRVALISVAMLALVSAFVPAMRQRAGTASAPASSALPISEPTVVAATA